MYNYYQNNSKRLYKKVCEIIAENTCAIISNKLGRSVTTEVEYESDSDVYVNCVVDGTPFKIYYANHISDVEAFAEDYLANAPEKDYTSDEVFLKEFKEFNYKNEKEVFVSLMSHESVLSIVKYSKCSASVLHEIIDAFDYWKYTDDVETDLDDYDKKEFIDHCMSILVTAFE